LSAGTDGEDPDHDELADGEPDHELTVPLYINMDDVSEHDPALYLSIQQNAKRYHQLFGDVVDSLIVRKLGDREVSSS
uniref:MCM_N domain-containing protein n=1 Tax=Gongylonema pulchrum TaxID=637853 RepID=A0A183ESN8_9BILA